MELSGKKALITGSSRGIGLEIARALANAGCRVVLNSKNNITELKSALDEIKCVTDACECYLADVSDYLVCKRLFERIGDIDILVNNAGISHVGLFTDMSPEAWRKVIDTNLLSVFNCTHLALKEMVRKKSGAIINISSVWGERGASCEAAYSASKGGVNAFTKAIAKEIGPSGIRVNAIACGVIDTKMNGWLTSQERAELTDEIALMKFGRPQDVAELAVFLASERSGYLTGQVITLDGGMY